MNISKQENLVGKLEDALSTCVQVDCKTTHTFSNGLYVRQLDIPKDTLIVGKRHRASTLNMLVKGKMTIIDGTDRFTIEAPYTFTADAYSKKAGYAHEDSSWVNIHITTSIDLDEIEKEVIITDEEYISICGEALKCLG